MRPGWKRDRGSWARSRAWGSSAAAAGCLVTGAGGAKKRGGGREKGLELEPEFYSTNRSRKPESAVCDQNTYTRSGIDPGKTPDFVS